MVNILSVTDDDNGVTHGSGSELILSCMVALMTAIMLSTSAGPAIVKPLLLDGSLISNGRFAFIYNAYETVGEDESPSVVGIGSSIMLAAMNGTCMQEESAIEGALFYNFAMSGGKPYSEMIQIPALIEAKPDVVMLEIGPNSLYGWESDVYQKGIHDYNEFRFQLMSMGMSQQHIGGWFDILDNIDKQWIDTDSYGKNEAWREYARDAIEELLNREIDEMSNGLDTDSYYYVPPVNSQGWNSYLSEPNYHHSRYEGKSPEYIRDDLDNRMPSKAKQDVYNPLSNDTQNHQALDYMIHELLNASINVVLVGIPHHPWVNEYLEPGQLDGMNLTYDRYTSLDGVTPLQMYWEQWPSDAFDNRNHADGDGREIFCKRVTPVIDAILNGGDVNSIVIEPSIYDIDKGNIAVLKACYGSNQTFYENGGLVEIQAETYSDCLTGLWHATDSVWQNQTEIFGYEDSGYVVATPDVGVNMGDTTHGPRLGYNLSFSTIGTYNVWIRMSAPDGSGDSIHVGLNGDPTSYGGAGVTTSPHREWNWEWASINVNSTGGHQLHIWMREDGVRIDSVILSNDENFIPNEDGG